MSDVTQFTPPQVGGGAMTTQTVKPNLAPNLAPTTAGTVSAIVGALRVMLPPGDATERLVLTVGALPEQARQEAASPMRIPKLGDAPPRVAQCPECDVVFVKHHGGQVFCSEKCSGRRRARLYRQRRNADEITES